MKMDVTLVLNCVIKLLSIIAITFVIPWIQEKKKNEKVAHAIAVAEDISKVAYTVANAAHELDIVGELKKLGLSKAEYALTMAEKELAEKGITYDRDLLIKEIKAAVVTVRINVTGTSAEKIVEQG